MNKFGIPDDVFAEITGVLNSDPELICVKIFGSRAKGNYKKYSDIDIAIWTNPHTDLTQDIKERLEDLDVIYRFDVVNYNSISNSELKEHIDRVGVEILT